MNLVYVDASERFLEQLAGVTDPEQKRKIIGDEFVRVFEARGGQASATFDFLAQGTLYPDVIESTTGRHQGRRQDQDAPQRRRAAGRHAPSTLVEPLRFLFKDEVRAVGLQLGLPEEIVERQPFPGPGLAVRCLGEITAERPGDRCARPTRSCARRSKQPDWRARSGSTSPCCCRCRRSA